MTGTSVGATDWAPGSTDCSEQRSVARRIAIQTVAVLVDAYRELNAKKLFWITLVLSGLVVAVFAAFGLNQRGVTFLWWELPTVINSNMIPASKFYKYAFAGIGVPVWLTWVASVLALISTAGIFPDFLSGGSIEMALSKPISRLRLFLTKYFMGLLFVVLQVLVFTLACFLVIGIRGGSWELVLFLAVPIVVIFYSYIYCVCVLVGLLTRSTIAAILLTCLFWLFLFGLNSADGGLLVFKSMMEARVEQGEARYGRAEKATADRLAKSKEEGGTGWDPELPFPPGATNELEAMNPMLVKLKADLASDRKSFKSLSWWHTLIYRVKTAMPKTADTVGLLNRYLLTAEEKAMFDRGGEQRPREEDEDEEDDDAAMVAAAERTEAANRERPLWWVVGTSLLFEGLVVGIAAVVFVRRDF
jgi:hypothetical protein